MKLYMVSHNEMYKVNFGPEILKEIDSYLCFSINIANFKKIIYYQEFILSTKNVVFTLLDITFLKAKLKVVCSFAKERVAVH